MAAGTEGRADVAQDHHAEVVSTIVESMTDVATSIPEPIRRNALVALSRLCTAAIDVPVAILEGQKLIAAAANQIAAQMKVDAAYVKAAEEKFAHRVVREQVNLDLVSQVALDSLRQHSDAERTTGVPDISLDWLNAFEREASQASSETMQRLFGRILAGEVRRPSSFSIRTIRLMAQLDGNTALLFRRLCSLSISLRIPDTVLDARVISLKGNAGQNSLSQYGLSFNALNRLEEHGLIISDYNSYSDYQPAVAIDGQVQLPMNFANAYWALVPKQPQQERKPTRLNGVALSYSGKELLPIVDIEHDDTYRVALQEYLESKGYALSAVQNH
jgi:hypothetical protein